MAQLGTVASLTETDIQSVLTSESFIADSAATFGLGNQTFVALNDSTAGFDANNDLLIEITGFTGSLSNLAII